MQIRIGRISIPSAGTAVRFTTEADIDKNMKLIWASFVACPDNTGSGFVGIADVSNALGFTLVKTAAPTVLPLRQVGGKGSINPEALWFDADNNNDKIEYIAFFE